MNQYHPSQNIKHFILLINARARINDLATVIKINLMESYVPINVHLVGIIYIYIYMHAWTICMLGCIDACTGAYVQESDDGAGRSNDDDAEMRLERDPGVIFRYALITDRMPVIPARQAVKAGSCICMHWGYTIMARDRPRPDQRTVQCTRLVVFHALHCVDELCFCIRSYMEYCSVHMHMFLGATSMSSALQTNELHL